MHHQTNPPTRIRKADNSSRAKPHRILINQPPQFARAGFAATPARPPPTSALPQPVPGLRRATHTRREKKTRQQRHDGPRITAPIEPNYAEITHHGGMRACTNVRTRSAAQRLAVATQTLSAHAPPHRGTRAPPSRRRKARRQTSDYAVLRIRKTRQQEQNKQRRRP